MLDALGFTGAGEWISVNFLKCAFYFSVLYYPAIPI